ncbi:MAG TPA: class I SAM-dependent methyltransferase [Gaiellaceae bacterium]|nr:class I SAM-dependent methyltransferase [Gaiellaceae bacterium]
MPAPAPEQIDVQALLERLREEVRWGGNGASSLTLRARARSAAEQFWAVTAERPPHGSAPTRLLKKGLRKLMRWYVEPFAQQQRSFNDAALKLIDTLFEELDRLGAEKGERERLLRELEERLLRLERRPHGAPATVAAQPAAAALPDYFAFESRMRGPTELVRERQRPYVEDLRGHAPVLDVGCGRGELVALLRDAGVEARGVDADADMVAYARGEGLDVEQGDLLAYLDAVADASLGAIFAGQVVEHLPPAAVVRFLEHAHAKLRPGGVLIAETINPLSPLALRNYFADLTHAQPLVPETLTQLVRHAGFRDVETRYLHEPERGELTGPVAEILFAPLDYAVLARK